jgi:hypothetical protein
MILCYRIISTVLGRGILAAGAFHGRGRVDGSPPIRHDRRPISVADLLPPGRIGRLMGFCGTKSNQANCGGRRGDFELSILHSSIQLSVQSGRFAA